MSSRVSVVVPLFNHERYIEEAIYSLLTQTHRPDEIIVVDDGSTDRSAAVVASLARRRPEIIAWSQENQGAHAALNAGIARSRGEVVAILNSDDVFEPQRLETAMAALEGDPALDAVFTGMVFIDAASAPTRHPWFERAMAFSARESDLGRTLINGNIFLTTSNLVARRGVFDAVGGFAALRYAHDLDFFLRLLAQGRRVLRLDEALLRYRLHGENTISEGPKRVKLEWAMAVAFYLHRQEAAHGGDAVARLRDILERHTLIDPVQAFMTAFREQPAETLEGHAVLQDEAVLDRVRALIG